MNKHKRKSKMKKNNKIKKLSDMELLDQLDNIILYDDRNELLQEIIDRYAALRGIDHPQNVQDSTKLTKRQKFIASAADPTYDGFSTKEEVKHIKLLSRGHYWDMGEDFLQFCSYSPDGIRRYFEYDYYSWSIPTQKKRWKQEIKLAAKLWAEGNKKLSKQVEKESYYEQDSKSKWVLTCVDQNGMQLVKGKSQ